MRFEWHSVGNIAIGESIQPLPGSADGPTTTSTPTRWTRTRHGNYIVSARQTSRRVPDQRQTGGCIWRLGGREDALPFGPGATFSLQHDARLQPDGTIRLFDNSRPRRAQALARHRPGPRRAGPDGHAGQARSATRRTSCSATQGNGRILADGGTFIGFGSQGRASREFDASGALVCDLLLPRGYDTYRAYRQPWAGRPDALPKLVATRSGLRVSWNGATQVASWQALAGPGPKRLAPVANVPTGGFETGIPAARSARYVAVQALDAGGAVLATSRTLRVG